MTSAVALLEELRPLILARRDGEALRAIQTAFTKLVHQSQITRAAAELRRQKSQRDIKPETWSRLFAAIDAVENERMRL